jgi:RNA polymerase sigma-70 factor (ECF subfamily)
MTEQQENEGGEPQRNEMAGTASDSAQLESLYQRFRSPLERFFRKRVRERHEIDDMVHEVFSRLSDKRGTVQEPEAYIFQIAANLLRDRARRSIFRKSANAQYIEENRDSFDVITPERVLLGKQRVAELKLALAELPERTRFVLLLQRYEGMKYREIAERLGISVSSVEKHMMKAIAHISRRMGDRP